MAVSRGRTRRQVRPIGDLAASGLTATPSCMLSILDEYRAQGLDPAKSPLPVGIFGLSKAIDPGTGAVLPDIALGGLVFTALTREAVRIVGSCTRGLTRPGRMDEMGIHVELAAAVETDPAWASHRFKRPVKSRVGIGVKVDVVGNDGVERSQGRAARIVDRRPKDWAHAAGHRATTTRSGKRSARARRNISPPTASTAPR